MSTVVLSSKHPPVGCLKPSCLTGGCEGNHPAPSLPISTHFYFHAVHGNCTMQLFRHVPVSQLVNILSEGKKVCKTRRFLWLTTPAFSDIKVSFHSPLSLYWCEGNQVANSPVLLSEALQKHPSEAVTQPYVYHSCSQYIQLTRLLVWALLNPGKNETIQFKHQIFTTPFLSIPSSFMEHDGARARALCHSWREPYKMQQQKTYTRITGNGLSIQSTSLLTPLCSNTSLDVGGEHAHALGKNKLGVTQCCFWLCIFRDMEKRS